VEELHGYPTVWPLSGSEVKNGRSGAEDRAPERLGCGTVKEEGSQILQRVTLNHRNLWLCRIICILLEKKLD